MGKERRQRDFPMGMKEGKVKLEGSQEEEGGSCKRSRSTTPMGVMEDWNREVVAMLFTCDGFVFL